MGKDGWGPAYMDLAVFQCSNMIPNEYYLGLVREKPSGKRAENVQVLIKFVSRMRGANPRVSRKQLAGHADPARE